MLLIRSCNVFPATGGRRSWPGASLVMRRSSTALISSCKARARPRFSTCEGATSMTSFLSLHDAVAEYVHDGATVALEGFTQLIPFTAGHEIIRQQKRHLYLIRMTPDLLYDPRIGMGCARTLVFSWSGNPGV